MSIAALAARPALFSLVGAALLCAAPSVAPRLVSCQEAPARSEATQPMGGARQHEPVAVVDGVPITRTEYCDYLIEIYAQSALRDLITERLLERECQRLGLVVKDEEVQAEWDQLWATWMEQRAHGDEAQLIAELKLQGHDKASYQRMFKRQKRREAMAKKIAVATRVIDEALLFQRFEQDFGTNGVSVEVRHIMLSRLRMKNELAQAGRPPAELGVEALDAAMLERAQVWMRALSDGANFEELAKQSHDVQGLTRQGRLPSGTWRRFGPAFVAAVEGAATGAFVGPVKTDSGVHVIWVESRTPHAFETERAGLLQRMKSEAATFQELAELDKRLWDAAKVDWISLGG